MVAVLCAARARRRPSIDNFPHVIVRWRVEHVFSPHNTGRSGLRQRTGRLPFRCGQAYAPHPDALLRSDPSMLRTPTSLVRRSERLPSPHRRVSPCVRMTDARVRTIRMINTHVFTMAT